MLISYPAFVIIFLKFIGFLWHICKKSKDWGAIVQNQYVFQGVLWTYVSKNLDLGTLLQKISSLSLAVFSLFVLKYSHISQFPLVNLARIGYAKTFVCFGVFRSKWACLITKTLKSQKLYTYWLTLIHIHAYDCRFINEIGSFEPKLSFIK